MTANASRDERNCGYSGVPAEPFFRGSERERERQRRKEGGKEKEKERTIHLQRFRAKKKEKRRRASLLQKERRGTKVERALRADVSLAGMHKRARFARVREVVAFPKCRPVEIIHNNESHA